MGVGVTALSGTVALGPKVPGADVIVLDGPAVAGADVGMVVIGSDVGAVEVLADVGAGVVAGALVAAVAGGLGLDDETAGALVKAGTGLEVGEAK